MEKSDFIFDIQAFHDENADFLPKEIAVIGVENNYFAHCIIKPPRNSNGLPKGILATNTYLTCFHHGIEWFDGESNLDDVMKAIYEVTKNAARIYVRGAAKQEYLERIFSRHIINLEEYKCPSFKNVPRTSDHFCFYHGRRRKNFSCALSYAYKLRKWLIKRTYDSTDKSSDECGYKPTEQQIDELCEKISNFSSTTEQSQSTATNSGKGIDKENIYSLPVDNHELPTDSTNTAAHS